MKNIFYLVLMMTVLSLASCKKEEKKVSSPAPTKASNAAATGFNDDFSTTSQSAKEEKDPLFEEKDESCDGTDKLEEKITEKKNEAFQLQGGDTGCDPNEKS